MKASSQYSYVTHKIVLLIKAKELYEVAEYGLSC